MGFSTVAEPIDGWRAKMVSPNLRESLLMAALLRAHSQVRVHNFKVLAITLAKQVIFAPTITSLSSSRLVADGRVYQCR